MDALEIGESLLFRHAAFQPANSLEVPSAILVGVGGQRRPQLRGIGKEGLGGQNADDRIVPAGQLKSLAEHVAVAIEQALPQAVAKQDHFGAARLVLLRKEMAAYDRL